MVWFKCTPLVKAPVVGETMTPSKLEPSFVASDSDLAERGYNNPRMGLVSNNPNGDDPTQAVIAEKIGKGGDRILLKDHKP